MMLEMKNDINTYSNRVTTQSLAPLAVPSIIVKSRISKIDIDIFFSSMGSIGGIPSSFTPFLEISLMTDCMSSFSQALSSISHFPKVSTVKKNIFIEKKKTLYTKCGF